VLQFGLVEPFEQRHEQRQRGRIGVADNRRDLLSGNDFPGAFVHDRGRERGQCGPIPMLGECDCSRVGRGTE
jgi:hypothetical protein